MRFVKYIKRQDSGWKQQPGYSGETSINLSQDISEYLTFGLVSEGEEIPLTFLIYKKDFIEALDFIRNQYPLYRTTSRTCSQIAENSLLVDKMSRNLEAFFGDDCVRDYTITLYRRRDGRIYLKKLKQNGFSIRDFLVENGSAIIFEDADGVFSMHISSGVCVV